MAEILRVEAVIWGKHDFGIISKWGKIMEITGRVDQYKKNIDQWRELEDKISGQYDMIAWTQFLGERSKKLRRIYAENADIIRKIHDRMERKLEERSAAQMFDSLMDLYHKAYDDACFLVLLLPEIILCPVYMDMIIHIRVLHAKYL